MLLAVLDLILCLSDTDLHDFIGVAHVAGFDEISPAQSYESIFNANDVRVFYL